MLKRASIFHSAFALLSLFSNDSYAQNVGASAMSDGFGGGPAGPQVYLATGIQDSGKTYGPGGFNQSSDTNSNVTGGSLSLPVYFIKGDESKAYRFIKFQLNPQIWRENLDGPVPQRSLHLIRGVFAITSTTILNSGNLVLISLGLNSGEETSNLSTASYAFQGFAFATHRINPDLSLFYGVFASPNLSRIPVLPGLGIGINFGSKFKLVLIPPVLTRLSYDLNPEWQFSFNARLNGQQYRIENRNAFQDRGSLVYMRNRQVYLGLGAQLKATQNLMLMADLGYSIWRALEFSSDRRSTFQENRITAAAAASLGIRYALSSGERPKN